MSATLVHRNPNLTDSLSPGSPGLGLVGPTMALSICRPVMVEGVPSRHGSAATRTRMSSAKSLSNFSSSKLEIYPNPMSSSLSASSLLAYPPSDTPPDNKPQGFTLPKLQSPGQKCYSASQASIATINPAGADDPGGGATTSEKSNPSSIFPNFRALQRLAASAKLRINGLKSEEAKAITAMWNPDSRTFTAATENCPTSRVASVANNGMGDEWSSHDEESIQHTLNVDAKPPKEYKHSKHRTKRLTRSRSRRKKNASKRKKTPSPALKKDDDVLGNFSLASTMTLNNRWENKKVETFSTKYKKFTNKSKSKSETNNTLNSTTHMTLTTVALERRDVNERNKSESADMPTARTVLEQAASVYGKCVNVNLRVNASKKNDSEQLKKVYLSERQSGSLKDCGKLLPCAPPTSPTPEQLKKFEYVPSLNDLRSQRAIKDRLSAMEVEEKKRRQKQREEKVKQEKQMQKTHLCVLRQRQRQEIYALNKMMTEHENEQFQKYSQRMAEKQT